MGRQVFVDMMSQPARAVVIFCRAVGIEHELVKTNIARGEHRTAEYRAKNPLGKIPCLVEGDFSLGESAAILRYLATSSHAPDHWYPADPRRRARVDMALDWHHLNIRKGAAGLVFNRVLAERLGGKLNPEAAREAEKILIAALKMLERFWLESSDFLASDAISIADLLMVTELDMLEMLDGADEGKGMEELLAPFPKVRSWMARVPKATSPHYKEASAIAKKAAERCRQRKAQRQSKL